jgi:hypothetical protein
MSQCTLSTKIILKTLKKINWAPVAHACNSSYSGGRDPEDLSLKPAPTNSSARLYLKKKKKTFIRKG